MDAGDTFIYGYPTFNDAIQDCFRAVDQEIDRKAVQNELHQFLKQNSRDHIISQELFTDYFRSLYRAVLEGLSFPGNLDHYVDYLWREWEAGRRLRLFDDAYAALQRLREADFRMGIISNWDGTFEKLLQRWGVAPWFDVQVVSCMVGMAKPDIKIFEYALAQAGIAAEQAWYLGDQADVDLIPAKTLGMKTILVDYYYKGGVNTADFTAGSMSEAVRIILDTDAE
jgi:putative hydrolase of the HAD superfamily